MHEVSMTDIEPLTYMSYKDIPTFLYTSSVTVNKLCPDFLGEKGILFALIFTKETITPYYAPNICNLRYGIQGNMVLRYKLLDPVNRMVCEKIEFYLVDDPFYVDNIKRQKDKIFTHEDESFEKIFKTDSVISKFYCDEMRFLQLGGVENFLDDDLKDDNYFEDIDGEEYNTIGLFIFYILMVSLMLCMAFFLG